MPSLHGTLSDEFPRALRGEPVSDLWRLNYDPANIIGGMQDGSDNIPLLAAAVGLAVQPSGFAEEEPRLWDAWAGYCREPWWGAEPGTRHVYGRWITVPILVAAELAHRRASSVAAPLARLAEATIAAHALGAIRGEGQLYLSMCGARSTISMRGADGDRQDGDGLANEPYYLFRSAVAEIVEAVATDTGALGWTGEVEDAMRTRGLDLYGRVRWMAGTILDAVLVGDPVAADALVDVLNRVPGPAVPFTFLRTEQGAATVCHRAISPGSTAMQYAHAAWHEPRPHASYLDKYPWGKSDRRVDALWIDRPDRRGQGAMGDAEILIGVVRAARRPDGDHWSDATQDFEPGPKRMLLPGGKLLWQVEWSEDGATITTDEPEEETVTMAQGLVWDWPQEEGLAEWAAEAAPLWRFPDNVSGHPWCGRTTSEALTLCARLGIKALPVIQLYDPGDTTGTGFHATLPTIDPDVIGARIRAILAETVVTKVSLYGIQIGNEVTFAQTGRAELQEWLGRYADLFVELARTWPLLDALVCGDYLPYGRLDGVALDITARLSGDELKRVVFDVHPLALSNQDLGYHVRSFTDNGLRVIVGEDAVRDQQGRWIAPHSDRSRIAQEAGAEGHFYFGRWEKPVWGVNVKRDTTRLGLEGPDGRNADNIDSLAVAAGIDAPADPELPWKLKLGTMWRDVREARSRLKAVMEIADQHPERPNCRELSAVIGPMRRTLAGFLPWLQKGTMPPEDPTGPLSSEDAAAFARLMTLQRAALRFESAGIFADYRDAVGTAHHTGPHPSVAAAVAVLEEVLRG